MTLRNQLAHATYNLIASQRPRRDARLLHDGGHGAGGCGILDALGQPDDSRVTCLDREQRQPYQRPTLPLTIGAARSRGSAAGSTPDVTAPTPTDLDTWQDARRRNASQRGYEYVAPRDTVCRVPASDIQPDTDCLRTDGELARICGVGFKHYVQYARWLILHDMSRAGGQGFTFDELYTRCVQLGCKGSQTHLRRIIRRGIGFYWNVHDGMIYPVGYVELVKRAVKYAHALGLHDLYLYGNHPGQRRDMYISVSGNAGDFEGAILAAWYGLHGCPTISRYTLSALLNRDARSIRRMERRACIRITYNEAQTTDPAAVPLNADGSLRGDVRYDAGIWNYRMPNTYTPRMTRQHPYKGQGRKAACWFKHWLSSDRLPGRPQANIAISDMGKLNCIWRTYCETDKALNASLKRRVLTTLYVATGRQHRGRVWKVARNEDI